MATLENVIGDARISKLHRSTTIAAIEEQVVCDVSIDLTGHHIGRHEEATTIDHLLGVIRRNSRIQGALALAKTTRSQTHIGQGSDEARS
jgi:hypothetical protein